MSVLTWTFESRYLVSSHTVTIILPDMPRTERPADFFAERKNLKVLWLLHGTFGDHSDWIRRTNIELYAAEKGIAVVMPTALNSNYSNWSNFSLGFDMYSYLTEELMPMVQNWLPVSSAREDNFIAGLSMGGRGAVKFAVNHPQRFAAAAVLSAAPMNFDEVLTPEYLSDTANPFTARLAGMVANAGGIQHFLDSEENVWRTIDQLAPTGKLPRLLFACGEDDELIAADLAVFRTHAEQIGLDAEFWTQPGFQHEWRFWDLAIQHALEFFELEDAPSNPF